MRKFTMLCLGAAFALSAGATSPEQGGTFETFLWTEDDFNAFTIINANDDNFTWEYDDDEATARLRSNSDRETPKDDWFISPAITLEAGKEYKITLCMRCRSDSKPEVFELLYGSHPTVEGMTHTIIRPTSVVNTDGCKYVQYITVDQTGDYYIGTHGLSPANRSYLYFDYLGVSLPVDLLAPAAPTGIKIVPDPDGEGMAQVSWTAPTLNVGGDQMTDNMSIDLLRDGEIIHSFADVTPGQQMTWLDDFSDYEEFGDREKSGYHTWTVVTANSAGPGKTISGSNYVGVNVPGAPREAVAVETDSEGEITISWLPPLYDRDGNPMNEDFLTYNIYDVTDAAPVVVATDVEDLSYTYVAVVPGTQDFKKYMVCAVTETGEGKGAYSRLIAVGTPYSLPFQESLAQGSVATILATYGMNGDTGWFICNDTSIDGVTSQDADNGYIAMQGAGYGHGSSLSTGKISLAGAVHPQLSFWTYNYGDNNKNTVEVEVSTADSVDALEAFVIGETGSVDSWVELSVDLTPYSGSVIQLAFPCIVYSHSLVLLDNIQVKENTQTGIHSVASDSDTTVEYFNLHGQRLENPAAGTIVIRRSGSKSEKLIMK